MIWPRCWSYQGTGHVDACGPDVRVVHPCWHGEFAKKAVRFHFCDLE